MSVLPNPVQPRSRRTKEDILAERRRRLERSSARRLKSGLRVVPDTPPAKPIPIWEASFKLGVNTLLILAAIASAARLIPNQVSQQAKLDIIQQEEAKVKQRVQDLEVSRLRGQNPEMAPRIAEENGNLIRVNKYRVVRVPNLNGVQ